MKLTVNWTIYLDLYPTPDLSKDISKEIDPNNQIKPQNDQQQSPSENQQIS